MTAITPERSFEVGSRGLATRRERAEIRRNLRQDTTSVVAVMRERPACIAELTVIEVLLMYRGFGRKKLAHLNLLAIRDGVNLMTPVGKVSTRTLTWLDVHVAPNAGKSGLRAVYD